MSKFQQAKDLYKLQKQAKAIKKKLKNIHIEAEEGGFTITFNAEQEAVAVKLNEDVIADSAAREALEKAILTAVNKGVKKAQEIAATNMQDIMSQMGLGMPGMGDDSQ
jgi:DNA-binding protein YbaB